MMDDLQRTTTEMKISDDDDNVIDWENDDEENEDDDGCLQGLALDALLDEINIDITEGVVMTDN
jgi:hypothetical protein